jgi:hypothetical protein
MTRMMFCPTCGGCVQIGPAVTAPTCRALRCPDRRPLTEYADSETHGRIEQRTGGES